MYPIAAITNALDNGLVPDIMLKPVRHNLKLSDSETTFVKIDGGISGIAEAELAQMQASMVEHESDDRPLILPSELEGVSNEVVMSATQITSEIATLKMQVSMLRQRLNEMIVMAQNREKSSIESVLPEYGFYGV